ncbi:MAG: TolC family protein [Polyangiaceae bacterium]
MSLWLRAAVLGGCLSVSSIAYSAVPESVPEAPLTTTPEGLELTLDGVMLRVRTASPQSAAGAARVRETAANLEDAEIYPRENPLLEFAAGPLIQGSTLLPSFSVGLSQTFELGPRTRARVAAVRASTDQTAADVADDLRSLQQRAGEAFLRGVWAKERIRLFEAVAELLQQAVTASDKRVQAGDASAVEASVARAALARAKSNLRAAGADLQSELGALRLLLGLEPDVELTLQGDLDNLPDADLDVLHTKALARPDLQSIQAEARIAQANIDLGDALAYPDIGIGVVYQLEGTDAHTLLATFSITLPFSDRGQGVTAAARARGARVAAQSALRTSSATAEVDTAYRVYLERRGAVSALEPDTVGGYLAAVAAETRAFEVGEATVEQLIALRRELVEAELERIDTKLQASLAYLALRHAAGDLP